MIRDTRSVTPSTARPPYHVSSPRANLRATTVFVRIGPSPGVSRRFRERRRHARVELVAFRHTDAPTRCPNWHGDTTGLEYLGASAMCRYTGTHNVQADRHCRDHLSRSNASGCITPATWANPHGPQVVPAFAEWTRSAARPWSTCLDVPASTRRTRLKASREVIAHPEAACAFPKHGRGSIDERYSPRDRLLHSQQGASRASIAASRGAAPSASAFKNSAAVSRRGNA